MKTIGKRKAERGYLPLPVLERRMTKAALVAIGGQLTRLPDNVHLDHAWINDWTTVGYFAAMGAFLALQAQGLVSGMLTAPWYEPQAAKAARAAILHPSIATFLEGYSGGAIRLERAGDGVRVVNLQAKENADG